MKKIGFTTSVPVEIIFSAKFKPVDLNNIFVSNNNPLQLVDNAENIGFPRNICTWIKGIYSALSYVEDLHSIIGVVEGDCSNTRALIEVLKLKDIECFSFSYPNSKNYDFLKNEIINLCSFLGVSLSEIINVKRNLDVIRKKLAYLDELTWKSNKVTGWENHLWQVSSSDFNGDYNLFEEKLDDMISTIEKRDEFKQKFRIGYIGVPPIMCDLYDFIETLNARVVYNEVQRQFTMADSIGMDDIVETYRQFTYPYDLHGRLKDIKEQIKKREIDLVVHYTQAFCFRGIEDIIIRKELGVPVLTIEGDRPGNLDSRTKLRIESFIDMFS
ncbi:UNVERIFIED_CONTAM: benzoyl-CoA reductase/2-hydroxyglutaryl-CoA dehydratase subunit BcrC/BadD/HgdB [Acetivibrio alkalicellulosi]